MIFVEANCGAYKVVSPDLPPSRRVVGLVIRHSTGWQAIATGRKTKPDQIGWDTKGGFSSRVAAGKWLGAS